MSKSDKSEPTLAQALSLIAQLSESETKKAREWSAEGRTDMAEICSGRASILNRVLYELRGGKEPAP
jgi:hypothetical protein